LDVFNLGYTLAMKVFEGSAGFPKEERYALTDQIRRSSRAVCSNVAEGFGKRRHEAVFKNSLNNALGEAAETKVWLDFALDCGYVKPQEHATLMKGYDQVGAMLWSLMKKWRNA
jgi:four helix bundle protein